MRGRFCTQPFLVERSACRPNAFLLPLRWVSRSPLHPPQCAHWGTFPPRGRLWAWEGPFPSARPPLPARPAGGRAVTGVGQMGRRPGRKKEDPLQDPPNQSRESRGENLSPLALFPPVSREKRGPPPSRRPTGRCAPRAASELPTRRVRSPAPHKKRDTPKGIPTFYSTVSWMEPVAFSACTMI